MIQKITTYSSAVLLMFTFSIMGVNAQDFDNLVENPSFEEKDGTLRRDGQIEKAKGWVPGTKEEADLFSKDVDDDEIGSPETYRGRCKPRTGNRFAGIRAYSYRDEEPRTYIASKLPNDLEKGVTYCVKFYVMLSPLSKYAVNNIGAYLSRKDITTDEEKSLIYEAQIMDSKNKIYKNRRLWEPVCATYTAKGREEYITIGAFVQNDEFETEKLRKPRRYKKRQLYDAYYFIDDVSITQIQDITECQCGEKKEEDKEPKFVYSTRVDLADTASAGKRIEARKIYFAYFSPKLESNYKKRLDEIANLLKDNPGLEVDVIGHTGTQEEKDLENSVRFDDLSLERAKTVVHYLKEKGISEDRLNLKAMQDQDLAAKGDTDFQRAKNRRVELKVK